MKHSLHGRVWLDEEASSRQPASSFDLKTLFPNILLKYSCRILADSRASLSSDFSLLAGYENHAQRPSIQAH
eukprot:COSAG02_NODE_6409_length_3592_cov_2.471514_1_plen_71_part_10